MSEAVKRHYLSSMEAAQYLNVSQSMLAKRRLSGDGPRYAKAGKRVIYQITDLDQWLADHTHSSTSEYELHAAVSETGGVARGPRP